jgi:hypothetical protein
MAQYISKGNIFGRIGTGIGKGLAEQVPKEIERERLSSGLQNFEKDSADLNPIQQLARISAIPGITPQMIQSFHELAKYQNQGNAYKRGAGGNRRPGQQTQGEAPPASPQGGQSFRDVQFANLQPQQGEPQPQQPGQPGQPMSPQGPVNNQKQTPNQPPNENVPQVVEGNALNQQNLTRLPWTPQQRQATIADYIEQGFLPDQAKQLQADDENRDLSEPAAHKQRLEDIDAAKGKVRETLKRHLETKLQKTGENVYKDVEGRMILNAERGMTRDLIKNPKADIDNVANDWSERLYRTAIAKDKMRTLGKTTGLENFLKGDQSLKKLKEYQDIFKRSGNLEEFKNMLEGPDFGMSSQAAASLAYPPNPKINNFLSNYRSSIQYHAPQKLQEARKAAIEIEHDIGPDDSVLSIVRKLSDKDPFFDQQSFLDQLSEDKDEIGLNERQRLELAEGARGILPNWADLLFLPIIRR